MSTKEKCSQQQKEYIFFFYCLDWTVGPVHVQGRHRPGEKKAARVSEKKGDAAIGLSPRKIISLWPLPFFFIFFIMVRCLFVAAHAQFRYFSLLKLLDSALQLLVGFMWDMKKAEGYKKEKQLNNG